MTRTFLAAGLLAVLASPALAEPALMLGGTVKFGGGGSPAFGVTAKILSDDREDEVAAALGLSWYPGQAQAFGIDVGAGYVFDNGALTVSYDFVDKAPAIGLGFVDSQGRGTAAPVVDDDD